MGINYDHVMTKQEALCLLKQEKDRIKHVLADKLTHRDYMNVMSSIEESCSLSRQLGYMESSSEQSLQELKKEGNNDKD